MFHYSSHGAGLASGANLWPQFCVLGGALGQEVGNWLPVGLETLGSGQLEGPPRNAMIGFAPTVI